MTHKRVGGLHFIRIGRLGLSLYISREARHASHAKVGGLHHVRCGRVGGSFYWSAR